MSNCYGISGIPKLPKHFVKGKFLCRVCRTESKKRAHKSGFTDIFQRKNILRNGGLNNCIAYIGGPALLLLAVLGNFSHYNE